MAVKRIEYEGHWITIQAIERGESRRWTYQIDDGPVRLSEDSQMRSGAVMFRVALSAAKAEVDSAKKGLLNHRGEL